MTLTPERFDAVYDEVARSQHVQIELQRLTDERRRLEEWLALREAEGVNASEIESSRRAVSEVKAKQADLAPASDVERRHREAVRGRMTLPLLELRVPLSSRWPRIATTAREGPFVDPDQKPPKAKPPAEPPPPRPREPLVALTQEVVAEHVRLRQRMREAQRTTPDPSWFVTRTLASEGYADVHAEVQFQWGVLRAADAWKQREAELEATMAEIEPLLVGATGQAYKDISDHYFGLHENVKAGARQQAAREASTGEGISNRRFVAGRRHALEALEPTPPSAGK